MRKFPVLGAAAALALGMVALAVPAGGQTAEAGLQTFAASDTWTVPTGVTCATFTVIGAEGGRGGGLGAEVGAAEVQGAPGGLGGKVQATLAVTPGSHVDITIGERGHDGSDLAPAGAAAGYPDVGATEGNAGDGGAVGGGSGGPGLGSGGGGGGGASVVAIAGVPVIVAGGGGGGGAAFDEGHAGGAGGHDEAAGADSTPNDDGEADGLGTAATFPAATGGGGATTTAGGAAGVNTPTEDLSGTQPTAGTQTNGGTGGDNGDGGGGGGGGLFGGGGGGGGYFTGGAGGGGGSSLVPAGATVTHGVDAENGGNGRVSLSFRPGDRSCGTPPGAEAPAAAQPAVVTPRFTG